MTTSRTPKVHFFSFHTEKVVCHRVGRDLRITMVPSEVTCAGCRNYVDDYFLSRTSWLLERYAHAPPSEERTRGLEEARNRFLSRWYEERRVFDDKLSAVENLPIHDLTPALMERLRGIVDGRISFVDPDMELIRIISDIRNVAEGLPEGEQRTKLVDAADQLIYRYEESLKADKEDEEDDTENQS